jgi:hypothetical protein
MWNGDRKSIYSRPHSHRMHSVQMIWEASEWIDVAHAFSFMGESAISTLRGSDLQ